MIDNSFLICFITELYIRFVVASSAVQHTNTVTI